MYKQKKLNNELEYSLDLLKRKREDLVSLFIKKDEELLRKTFEYEKSPTAFSLVRSQFITQWINEHFEQITDDDISDEVRKSAVKVCSQLISEDKDKDSGIAEFKQAMVKEKLKIIQEFIATADRQNQNLEKLKLIRYKNKRLFERKLEKYIKEMEFFVGHPGGTKWEKQDYWALLKGGVEDDEDWLTTAIREFQEESGYSIKEYNINQYIPLGSVMQNPKKTVIAYGLYCPNIDSNKCYSNIADNCLHPEIDKYR